MHYLLGVLFKSDKMTKVLLGYKTHKIGFIGFGVLLLELH